MHNSANFKTESVAFVTVPFPVQDQCTAVMQYCTVPWKLKILVATYWLIIGRMFHIVFFTHSGILILKFVTPYVEHCVCKRMRCDITTYSKSSDISAFELNIAVAWICHLNVSLNSGDSDFWMYIKESGHLGCWNLNVALTWISWIVFHVAVFANWSIPKGLITICLLAGA